MAKYKTEVVEAAGYAVTVTYKPVKGMRLRVSNRDASVALSAPRLTSRRRIIAMIEDNKAWLDATSQRILSRLESTRNVYEAGASFSLFGDRLTLRLLTSEEAAKRGMQALVEQWEQGRPGLPGGAELPGRAGAKPNKATRLGQVWADREYLWVWLPPEAYNPEAEAKQELVESLVERYFEEILEETLQGFLDKWFPRLGLKPLPFRVRQMSTRWGSYSARTRKITFNRSLVHYRRSLIEYVVVHELTHCFDMSHGSGFQRRMDEALPNWRTLRRELNRH